MSYEKYYNEQGQVAVLYSPGYGAGWFTWNESSDNIGLIFDKEIVEAVLQNDTARAAEIALQKYPGAYTGGACDLRIKWLEQGTEFVINEYDGAENILVTGMCPLVA